MHTVYHDDYPRPRSSPHKPWLGLFAEAIFNAAPLANDRKRENPK